MLLFLVTLEFYQKTRITLAVVNILINYRQMRSWRQNVENSNFEYRSRGRRGDVTRWTSNSSARHLISFSVPVIAKDVTKPDGWLTRIIIYLTLRRAGLSASAELLVCTWVLGRFWAGTLGCVLSCRDSNSNRLRCASNASWFTCNNGCRMPVYSVAKLVKSEHVDSPTTVTIWSNV